MRHRLLCYCLVLLLMLSGALAWAQEPVPAGAAVRVERELTYRTEATITPYERELCKLDLYLPVGTPGFPVIVWFHGGGLDSGSRDGADRLGRRFAQDGIAVAAADYRLAPEVAFPAFVDDAAAAVAWVKAHIAEYGGNPRSVFVGGHSAGGYLAAFVGVAPQHLEKYGVALADLAGIVPVSGQMFTHTTIRQARGITAPRETPLLDEAAPCHHVRKDAPPFLLICADNDNPLRADENRFFVAAMKYVGHTNVEYLEIADRDHASIFGRIPEPEDPTSAAIVNFVRRFARQAPPEE